MFVVSEEKVEIGKRVRWSAAVALHAAHEACAPGCYWFEWG
jgi:hypothetical protein